MSGTELARSWRESSSLASGHILKKGDVVWTAMTGTNVFEGSISLMEGYLRDMSFMFDRGGHLPSWLLNAFSFAPRYYHNIVRSSDAFSPLSTSTFCHSEIRSYRRCDWSKIKSRRSHHKARATESPNGSTRSDQHRSRAHHLGRRIQVVDAGWHGKIVIETEGTAEHGQGTYFEDAQAQQNRLRPKQSCWQASCDADGRPRVPKAPARREMHREQD